jgi:hypothetical protein
VLFVVCVFVAYLRERDKNDRVEREAMMSAQEEQRISFVETIKSVGTDVKESSQAHRNASEAVCNSLNKLVLQCERSRKNGARKAK